MKAKTVIPAVLAVIVLAACAFQASKETVTNNTDTPIQVPAYKVNGTVTQTGPNAVTVNGDVAPVGSITIPPGGTYERYTVSGQLGSPSGIIQAVLGH